MTHGSLFSGIGGFDLAAEWMGWENIFHCEWNGFGQKILKHYWPDAISYTDITKTDFSIHRGEIDIVTGGFPCQPYSQAGKRKGKEDDRHLWPEMLRAIREIQPRWIVGENVLGLLNWSRGLVFHEVQTDLEAAGYIMFPYVLPACAKDAPHRRDRVWIVAYRNSNGQQRRISDSERGNKREPSSEENRKQLRYETFPNERNGIITNPGCWSKGSENKSEWTPDNITGFSKENDDATDTEGNGINRAKEHENNNRQGGERGGCNADNFGEIQRRDNAANPNSGNRKAQRQATILGQQESKGKARGYLFSGNRTQQWDSFPTQSPLCSRNDGLSPELAGITISKHRTESIKGYGNAIVPQVAYEIFKAIQQYDNYPQTTNAK